MTSCICMWRRRRNSCGDKWMRPSRRDESYSICSFHYRLVLVTERSSWQFGVRGKECRLRRIALPSHCHYSEP